MAEARLFACFDNFGHIPSYGSYTDTADLPKPGAFNAMWHTTPNISTREHYVRRYNVAGQPSPPQIGNKESMIGHVSVVGGVGYIDLVFNYLDFRYTDTSFVNTLNTAFEIRVLEYGFVDVDARLSEMTDVGNGRRRYRISIAVEGDYTVHVISKTDARYLDFSTRVGVTL